MKFTSDVTVLSARRYQMADDKTGELIQGTKIAYVEDWDGQTEQNKRGVPVLSANFPYETFETLGALPAVFSATFTMQEGARGRAVLKLSSLEYKSPFRPLSKTGVK